MKPSTRSEVVVVEFLALGRLGTEEGAPGVQQVGTSEEEVAVDQEILLLRTAERDDVVEVLVPEELQDALGLFAHRLLGAQQRRLMVQRLAGHRDEDGGDAQRVAVGVLEHVGGARDIPAGVAASLERVAQAAVGEAGCVGLALHERLAREFGESRTIGLRFEEAVVLLGGQAGEGVEDVRVVGGALLERPVLHGRRHGIRHQRVEGLAALDGRDHGLVDRLRQALLHDRLVEDVLAVDLAGGFGQ
jgi:hypothetical protein